MIGAGVGGLAAAIDLAARGWRVTVLEAAAEPGGKAGTTVLDGVEVDTGPSVLTLPEVFDEILRLAGTSLPDEIELVRPSPAFRYVWPDGAVVDAHVDLDATLASVGAALGPAARDELAAFVAYAGRVWRVAERRFVRGRPPTWLDVVSPSAIVDLMAIDPLRSMAAAIRGRIREPHLRDLLLRYATYAGSDPRRAPATLNCIAHVELALGGFGVRGGIAALVRALVRAAESVGVEVRTGEPVVGVDVAAGRVLGARTARGPVGAEVVVCNADAAYVADLVPGLSRVAAPTSTSGWTAIVRAAIGPRIAHTVLFPARYEDEFVDLFERRRVPEDPTVYACAQRVCHGRAAWPDGEPVFVMVNAPPDEAGDLAAMDGAVLARLRAAGLAADGDRVVWRRTPRELAARFPGSGGALYGAAHDGPMTSFRRAGNRVPGVRGLYLAGGSVHPGGGLPLAALSGRAAARAAWEDR